jgi:cell division protease FtsH
MFDRMVHDKPYSEDTAKIIDTEVESLIHEAATRAEEVIKANKPYLKKLADVLLEKETVDAEEVLEIFEGSNVPDSVALAK